MALCNTNSCSSKNDGLPIQTTPPPPSPPGKPSKMPKEKERLFYCKFADKKKVGPLFLCLISTAVFTFIMYVGNGKG